jgi:putative peptidoglycan lipid II flippase
MYNLGIIFGIIFFVPRLGLPGWALGVVFGALLHFLIQLPVFLKIGFRPKKLLDFSDLGFKKVVKLTIPRSIGLAAAQIDLFVVTGIASTLSAGSLAVFNLASGLSRPLLILIGISFSTAAFPQLALSFSTEKREKFLQIFSKTFSKIILLIVPASIMLFLLRDWVVEIILKVGKFGLADSRLTAACLGMFSLGLFADALILLIVKAFYATQDTKTPALASVLAMAVNISLCFLFLRLFSFSNSFSDFFLKILSLESLEGIKIIGLPLALSLSSVFQFVFLWVFFRKKVIKKNE